MTTRKRYPTDLTDKQWEQLQALLPQKRTPPEKTREYINGILYILRTGCSWRMMPHDLPNWSTVKTYFHKLRRDGTWERINDVLREKLRQESGREAEPSVLIVDSQSVKTTEKGGARGYDGGKRVKGRKRHIVVDTQGWLVRVMVHPANWSDKDSAKHLLKRVPLYSRWQKVLFDAGYDSPALLHWCAHLLGVSAEIVRRADTATFTLLPKRWIVERTFAWLGKCRRLSKDYEYLPAVSETWTYVAMIHLMLRRLCP